MTAKNMAKPIITKSPGCKGIRLLYKIIYNNLFALIIKRTINLFSNNEKTNAITKHAIT